MLESRPSIAPRFVLTKPARGRLTHIAAMTVRTSKAAWLAPICGRVNPHAVVIDMLDAPLPQQEFPTTGAALNALPRGVDLCPACDRKVPR